MVRRHGVVCCHRLRLIALQFTACSVIKLQLVKHKINVFNGGQQSRDTSALLIEFRAMFKYCSVCDPSWIVELGGAHNLGRAMLFCLCGKSGLFDVLLRLFFF